MIEYDKSLKKIYEEDTISCRNLDLRIDVSVHAYDFEHRENKYDDHRICFYLRRPNNTFVDNFDIDYFNGTIRFYGSTTHYSVSKVPKYIKKLWRCDDFKSMILDEIDKSIAWREEHNCTTDFMYELLIESRLAIVEKGN